MSTKKLVLVSLLVALILSACGGGGGDDPVDVVESVVKAMEKLDTEEASKHVCSAQRAQLDEITGSFDELAASGIDADEFLEAFKIKMDDMKYEEKSKSGDNAEVHVSGTISLDFDTDKLKEIFKKAAEAEGQEVSDEEVDFLVNMFSAMGGQEAPFEGDVALNKEDGDWKVCDELDFLNEVDLGF